MKQSVSSIKRVYFVVLALTWLSVAIPLPIFVLYMQSRGIDLFQVGIIMGTYSLVIVLLELPTGGLADAIGRKIVALMADVFTLSAGVVMLLSFSFGGFLLAMILNGVGRALSSGSLDAWFVDSLQDADPQIDLQPALAQAGTVTLLALGIGALIGGFLPQIFSWLPDEGTAVLTPLSTTIVLSIAVQIVLIAVIIFAVKEKPRESESSGDWRRSAAEVPHLVNEAVQLSRSNLTLLNLMGAAVIGGFALAGVETFWQPHFADIMGGGESKSWMFGIIMAVSFLVGVAGNLLSIPISKRLGKRYAWVAALARGGQGLALIILATKGYIVSATAGFWLFFLTMGIQNSPHETLVNEEIPSSRRSAMLSVQSLASYIGGFLGSVLLGFVAQRQSINLAWLAAGALTLASMMLYVNVAKHRKFSGDIDDEEVQILDRG